MNQQIHSILTVIALCFVLVLGVGGVFTVAKAIQGNSGESFTLAAGNVNQVEDEEAVNSPPNVCHTFEEHGVAEFIEIERCMEDYNSASLYYKDTHIQQE